MPPESQINKENSHKDLEEVRNRVVAFCNEAGYQLSPQAEAIFRDIVRMKQLTGDYYCPCQPQQLLETICVCQPVRNGLVDISGACFCNLILSSTEEKE